MKGIVWPRQVVVPILRADGDATQQVPSVTMPIISPSSSTTGRPLMEWAIIESAALRTLAVGWIEMTLVVMTFLASIFIPPET